LRQLSTGTLQKRVWLLPDPTAGVCDTELRFVTQMAAGDGHATPIGELDGITDQVDQYLLQAYPIGNNLAGAYLGCQFDSLFRGLRLQRGNHGFGDRRQRQSLGFQGKLSGFDLGDIQQVIDEI
jgi:hypothetical protein